MGIETRLRTMFTVLTLICVLVGTTGLAACTCQEDCQTDRNNCENGCDTTHSECEDTCLSQQSSCENGCENTYNSCMSGCGGDPDCEMMCVDDRMMCDGSCQWQGDDCRNTCYNDHSNCNDGCGSTYDACIAACPPPPSITHTKGRYWVNHTWVLNCTDESVPTSYNVSINQTWHNGTATKWYNNTGLQGGVWSNIVVLAWNATSGTICSVTLSENVYLPLPLPPAPVGTGSTWDFFWVNHTWSVGSDGMWAGDTDSFNVSIETHWINGTTKNEWKNGSLTTFYNNSLDGEYGWSNITVWSYNATGGLNSTYIYQNVEVPIFVPPTPVNPQSTSGRFWVNHTWSPGTGHHSDSYNVSLESDGWHNGTLTTYYKEPMSSNGWSNITVYAYNNTHHKLSESSLTQNVLISWTNDVFVNTSGWWRDGDVFNATAEPFSRATDNVVTGESIRVYDGTYYEAAWLPAGRNDITITPVSGRPIINPSKQQNTLLIGGDNVSVSGFEFRTPLDWIMSDGCALAFYGSDGSTSSNNDFKIRHTSYGKLTAIDVWNSENCTISGGEMRVDLGGGVDIDTMSSGTTVTGVTILRQYTATIDYGIRIKRSMLSDYYRQHNTITGNTIRDADVGIQITTEEGHDARATFDDTNVVSGNSIYYCTVGIELNASCVTAYGGWITCDMPSNSVYSNTYGVKHLSSSITWNGSTSSNTYNHYFSGDTSGSVILNPSSLANLYLADASSTCTITNTDGRMFDVCGARHEYIDELAYMYPNGTFSRHISDSSPLEMLNLLFYNDFTITPTSAPVSVSNIEFFGSACDATGGHDVEVDVASSTPANEVRFNITGDSTWINDYVDMGISSTFVKREKASVTSFVSILYTGGFSSHHFEFDEIYIPGGGGGANPFTDYSFECQNYEGSNPDITTFCNWSQSGSCSGGALGCEFWWNDCGANWNSGSGVCRTGTWHTDGDYSAWIVSTIVGMDNCQYNNDCAITTTVYQSVDLTGIDTISFDARFRDHADFEVRDCDDPGSTADVHYQKAIDMYVDGTRVWRKYYMSFTWGAYEGFTSYDYTFEHLEQEADVSTYTGTHDIKLVSYIAFQGDIAYDTIDGWMQMQGFFDNMGVTYSVQPPENLLYEACPYYVNHTWDTPTGGAVIDSYNVSVNSVWHNGTTDTFYKDTSLTDWWQWSNISVYSFNTTEGLSPGNSSATVQLTPAIPVPTDLSHTEGHIWIRHTWAPGSSFSCLCVPTQSYNISVNDVWYNGTTDPFYDDTGLAYEEWSNITVYAYNSDAGIISNVPVTQNLKVDTPPPATPVGGTGEWGFFWVNHSWSAGSGPENSDTDSYNYSITTIPLGGSPSTIWYNDSTNTSHNNSIGTHGWSNIVVYAWNDNVTSGLSDNAIYQNINIPKYTPPTPLNIDATHGTYWVNHTWQAGSGNVVDSYNVSITTSQNEVWHNDTLTTYFNDTTVVACGWSNIVVWAWNDTGGLSEGSVSQDVNLPEGHPAVPESTGSTWGFFWVNHSWEEGDSYGEWCATTDSYNYSITTHLRGESPSTIWYNDSTNTSHNNSMEGFGWSNLTVWAWNGAGGLCGLSGTPLYQNTEVIQYTPPNPTYIHNETDQYGVLWANFSWACDEGGRGLADSFNVSVNYVWHNGTTLCDNNQPVPEDSDFEDNTLMGWTTSGTYAWTSTAYGYESTYAIRDGFTGTATGSSTAWKTITLDEYGSLYFDCKLNDGTLTVYNGSETLYEITGTHDWQNIQINLTAGTHTIKFTYTRPASPTPENHVWIDNVVVRQRINGWYLANRELDHDISIIIWAWNATRGGLSESSVEDISVCGAGTFYDNWYILTGAAWVLSHGHNWTGLTWQSDPGIERGLGGECCSPHPTVFRKDKTWHLIVGLEGGTCLGRTWNGSTWQSDPSIVSGLGYVDMYPQTGLENVAPTAFQKDGTWHIISGEKYGRYRGYTWDGSTWQSDPSIVSGLGTGGGSLVMTTPIVFQKDGAWHLIAGNRGGTFDGFTWDGSTWQSDPSIVSGLGDVGRDSVPFVFPKDGAWHLISGFGATRGGYWDYTYYGGFRGYTWDGSTWQSDPSIVSGLADTVHRAAPAVFYISYDIFSPTNLAHTTGFFWVNHTWEPGTGLIPDSYNVSINGIWHNETTVTYYNDTSPVDWGQWSTIEVYSYNATINKQSYICASDEVQLLPTLTPWNDFTSGSQQAFAAYDRGITVEFKCTSDTDVETWTWYGVDSSSGTSNSNETTALKTFSDWGDFPISVRASNAYETISNVTWIVDIHAPDDWFDPNYQVATPILVYSCCNSTIDLGFGEFPVMDYYVEIDHVDTTNCLYSDCQDMFFYDPRYGVLPFYTRNSGGSVHKTTDETVYVQMSRLTAGAQVIYMYSQCAPNRVLRANQFGGYAMMPSMVEKDFSFRPPCDETGDIYLNHGSIRLSRYNSETERCEGRYIYGGDVGSQVSWSCSNVCGAGSLSIYGSRIPKHGTIMYDTDLFLIQYGGAGVGMYINSRHPWYGWNWGESCWVSFGGHNTVIPNGEGTYSFLVTGRWGDLSAGGTPARLSVSVDHGFGNNPCNAKIYTIYYSFAQDTNPCAVESYFGYDIDEPAPVIVVYDQKENMVSGINYMIYDNDNSEVYCPWTTDNDGAVYLNDPADRNITFMVRTYAGMFTQDFSLTSGSIVNTTLPIKYNIDIRAFDEGGRRLDETVCTLSEYTPCDPGFFWGLAMSNRTSIRMKDLSSFGMCDLTVEKAGYAQYNATGLNWTSQSTMIKDYKHDAILTTE